MQYRLFLLEDDSALTDGLSYSLQFHSPVRSVNLSVD